MSKLFAGAKTTPGRQMANPVRALKERADIQMATDHCAQAPAFSHPIDLVHLARQSLGDRELEAELFRLFSNQARQIIARLQDGPQQPDTRIADLAHTLKGSARAIGAGHVAVSADKYEQSARTDGLTMKQHLKSLIQDVTAANAAIENLLN